MDNNVDILTMELWIYPNEYLHELHDTRRTKRKKTGVFYHYHNKHRRGSLIIQDRTVKPLSLLLNTLTWENYALISTKHHKEIPKNDSFN